MKIKLRKMGSVLAQKEGIKMFDLKIGLSHEFRKDHLTRKIACVSYQKLSYAKVVMTLKHEPIW